jgi:acyl-CoA dehydrogenase
MADRRFLAWPFFEPRHRDLADAAEHWAGENLPVDHADVDAACRDLVAQLGKDGWLTHTAVNPDEPGGIDVRSLCLIRETLARHDALADFSFAMQGLGTLTEANSGSDVANIELSARADADGFLLNGEKMWISNGGIADIYVVFARTGEATGAKGISAFLVAGDNPGLEVVERLEVIAPHPLARLRFNNCRVARDALIGQTGQGFKIAMATLDVFRATVGAAALGFARRALDESVTRARDRKLFGGSLADLQLMQGHIADMALAVDAAALLVYRAAWVKDAGAPRVSREAAMAKLFATEKAQQVIDKAVQIHGGDGVRKGSVVESLYREIRALRIYEGASEVQKVIIARDALAQ